MIRMESESESGEEEKSDDVVVIVEQGPATNSKSQSRPVKGESRPATIKYDNRAPADEDLEIKEWPAVSDEDVDEPIVQRVVEEVANREDGQQADIESPITKLDFTMSAPVGPSVEILANMPPPPPPCSPPFIPPPPPSTPAVTIQPPTPHTSQDLPLALPARLLEVPAEPDTSTSKGKKRSRSPSPSGSSEPRRSPRLRSPSPLPSHYTQVEDAPKKKKPKKN